MEQNNIIKEESPQDEKIQIYENDDAYLLGDDISPDENLIINNIDNNKNELLNKFNINSSQEGEHENQEIINENNDNNNKDADISLENKKYLINDINSDLEGEENDINNDNIKGEKYINNNINKNIINNNINNNIENISSDSEFALLTLNNLSICQCCKSSFNSGDNVPYLFNCGHFLCKQCITQQFKDEEGIKCPLDGLVANSISELKILNNFITDKTVTQRTSTNCLISSGQFQIQNLLDKNNNTNSKTSINNNFTNNSYKACEIHKGQKLTHFIEETKELICVYCAFERFKQNQGIEIKEIVDKCHEMEQDMDLIIEENQYNVGIIQTSLKEIKKNKENEEKKICEVFEKLFDIVKSKRDEYLNKIDNLFTNNAEKLSQKLELFSYKIEKGEEVKDKISIFLNNEDNNKFLQLLEYYNKVKNEIKLVQNLKLTLQKYKFCHDDEIDISKIISNFGEIKLIPKTFTFMGNFTKDEQNLKITINNSNENILENYSVNNINYDTSDNFKNYNFIENINSIKNNNSNNFYKASFNSCNNTIIHKNKIRNNNLNRNSRIRTHNNRVIDSNCINNTFTNTYANKKNMNNIKYSQKLNGGTRLSSPNSKIFNNNNNIRNSNEKFFYKDNYYENCQNKKTYNYNTNIINNNGLIKNNNLRKNKSKQNLNNNIIKYDNNYQF